MDEEMDAIAQHALQAPPQSEDGLNLLNDFSGAEQELRVSETSEFYNLAQGLDPDLAKEIAQEIKSGYNSDEDSRSDWLDMHTFWLSLYMQTDYSENSNEDRDWGATESIPILTEACNQFQSRTYKTFFPQSEFVSAKVSQFTTDPVKQKLQQERADRIGRHMSWQLGVKDRYFKKDKSALFLGVALHGSFFTKTYFDTKKKKVCIDNVRPTDLVIDYNCGPIRLEDVRRKSHIVRSTMAQASMYKNQGYFSDLPSPEYGDKRSQYDVKVDDAMGLTPGSSIRKDGPLTLIEQHFYLDIDDTGNFLPYIGTIDLSSGKLLRLTIGYDADPTGQPLQDYEQIQYFTHYKFQENPDGFYGLGMGHMLGDLNSAINIMTRQAMDAATLANDGNMSGFISERLCMNQEDESALVLGRLKKVPDQTGDIRDGITLMQFPGPNQALLAIIQELDRRAQRLGSTTEATTGTIDTNRQPTTVLAQIDQSLEMFSSVQMNLSDALSDELQKVYRLNQHFLPFVEYFAINNAGGQITRSDYQNDLTVEPIFDPKFATRAQKVAKAQAELDATIKNPLSQTRPFVFDVAFRRYLEALEVENIDELIPPPPTPTAIATDFARQALAGPNAGMAASGPNQMDLAGAIPQISSAEGLGQNQVGQPTGP